MSLNEAVIAAIARARRLPARTRYMATLGIVVGLALLRWAADPVLPPGDPSLFLVLGILLASALFDHGAGLFATLASAALVAQVHLSARGAGTAGDGREFVALAVFVAIGSAVALTIGSLHRALAEAQQANEARRKAHDRLADSEQARRLLIREFRHRTRNDLGSLASVLYLRARGASSDAAREGLREAAEHAMALARVHTWLALSDGQDLASVDTREFVLGLCNDLSAVRSGEGLRPIVLLAEAEVHALDAERAIQLGLVLNEAVTNAMKYAFPEDRPGTVRVRFGREGEAFLLTVEDDGIGLPREGDMEREPHRALPAGSGLGTRLLRGLAAQLRGSFTRRPGPEGRGTVAELRFPIRAAATPKPARRG